MAVPLVTALTSLASTIKTGVHKITSMGLTTIIQQLKEAFLRGLKVYEDTERISKNLGQTQQKLSGRIDKLISEINSQFSNLATETQLQMTIMDALAAGMFDVGKNTVALIQQQKLTGRNEAILTANLRSLAILTGMNSEELDLFSNRAIALSEQYAISTADLISSVRELGLSLQQYRLIGISKDVANVASQLTAVMGQGSQDIVNHLMAFIRDAENIPKMAIMGITDEVSQFFNAPDIKTLLDIIQKAGTTIDATAQNIKSNFGALDIKILESMFGTGANSMLQLFDQLNQRGDIFNLDAKALTAAIEEQLAGQHSQSMQVDTLEQILQKLFQPIEILANELSKGVMPKLANSIDNLVTNVFPDLIQSIKDFGFNSKIFFTNPTGVALAGGVDSYIENRLKNMTEKYGFKSEQAFINAVERGTQLHKMEWDFGRTPFMPSKELIKTELTEEEKEFFRLGAEHYRRNQNVQVQINSGSNPRATIGM